MVSCFACSGQALYRETSGDRLVFCTHLCQRAWHGIGRRILSRAEQVPSHTFFDAQRPRVWWESAPRAFPTKAQVYAKLHDRSTWPDAGDVFPGVFRPKGESMFEVGASEAALPLAVYSNPQKDAPFLPSDIVMLLKNTLVHLPQSAPGPGANRREILGYEEATATDDVAINEACTGVRVAALFFAGISRAFVPVVDFFPCACTPDAETSSPQRRFFTVQPVVENAVHVWDGLPRSEEMVVPYIRSVLGQLLVALEAAQEHLSFTHYDLNTGNVLAEQTDIVDGEAWTFVRRGSGRVCFDPRDTQGRLVRIIDYGLSRAESPYGVPTETFWQGSGGTKGAWRAFNAFQDTRSIAYFLIEHIVTARREVASAVLQDSALMRVLTLMLGVESWKTLKNSPTGEYAIFAKRTPRLGHTEDIGARLSLPFKASDLLQFGMKAESRISDFYWGEILPHKREDVTDAPLPGDVVNDAFFDVLRVPAKQDAVLVDIGDASRSFPAYPDAPLQAKQKTKFNQTHS